MGVATATFVESFRGRDWRHFDLQLFLYVLLLIGFGVVMGYSAGFNDPGAGDGMTQTVKTLIWAAIGLTVFFVVASFDYHWLRTLAGPIYVVVLVLLTVTMLVGTNLFGAQMSVTVGGLDFQFSEVSKVLMIAVLGAYLAGRRERIGRLATILVAGALMAVPAFLVFRQPDLGTALVFIGILVGMLFMSGASLGWMGLFVGGVIAAAPLVVGMLHDYQRQRLFCFLDPAADPQGACFQLVQALNAVGSGGWLGRGLTVGGEGQRGYIPVQSTDFIFTVVAEDLGFVGGVVMLVLFGLLAWRILLIGWQARDAFGMMIAVGLASMILFQVLVNIGMVIGVMPVTGIPLPFVTYGGSSLISLLFGMGILQSIRMRAHKPTL
ncbi:MAG TPA: FtsW/RodA/SpoVE family cell cycle protein [Candidatus Limnocylindrales bacterium]|nr:FtsW/RodA/SpoVE family cell cycle protein [Candidatus Limnocylindrales bacterium]